MKQNKYFKIDEFKCKCGCEMPEGMPSDKLIDLLVDIREHFNKRVKIKSGYRCPKHNKQVGGAPKSRHIVGDAADFVVREVTTKEVFKYVLQKYNNEGCGIAININPNDEYAGFVHLDTRGYKARWGYNEAGKEYVALLKQELGLV